MVNTPVAQEGFQTQGRILCRNALPGSCGIAKAQSCVAFGLLAALAGGHVVVDGHLYVLAQFSLDFAIEPGGLTRVSLTIVSEDLF